MDAMLRARGDKAAMGGDEKLELVILGQNYKL